MAILEGVMVVIVLGVVITVVVVMLIIKIIIMIIAVVTKIVNCNNDNDSADDDHVHLVILIKNIYINVHTVKIFVVIRRMISDATSEDDNAVYNQYKMQLIHHPNFASSNTN